MKERYNVIVEVAGKKIVAFSNLPKEKAEQYKKILADPKNLNPKAIAMGINHYVVLVN